MWLTPIDWENKNCKINLKATTLKERKNKHDSFKGLVYAPILLWGILNTILRIPANFSLLKQSKIKWKPSMIKE